MEKNKYIKQQNNDIELYCSIVLIPLVFCTVVNTRFTSLFGGYILFCVYAFSFVCLLIFNRHQQNVQFDIKAVLSFLCFILVYILGIGNLDDSTSIFSVAFFSVAVVYAFGVVYNSKNLKMLKFIWVVFLVSITITVVLSVRVLIENPGASRVLASSAFERYGASEYRKQGLGGFGLTYSLVFFIPLLIYWINHAKKKAFAIALLILTSINILLSGYTTAFLLIVLALCLYIFFKLNSYQKTFLVIFLVFFVIFQKYFLPDFLYYLSELFGSKQMAEHLVEIADILAGEASLFDLGRVDLLEKSWEMFLTNPLFGGKFVSENFEIGGHSTFMDILGTNGLLGFVPYCLFLYFFHKQVKTQIKNPLTQRIWVIETILFFALQVLNPIMANYEIVYMYMGMVPAALFYIEMIGEKQIEGCTD